MHSYSYFNTAIKLITSYDGKIPLSSFLKQYFSQNKKHGSKDRKSISHLCYNYYRLGHALKSFSKEERLKVSIFLCNNTVDGLDSLFDEQFLNAWNKDLNKRIEVY